MSFTYIIDSRSKVHASHVISSLSNNQTAMRLKISNYKIQINIFQRFYLHTNFGAFIIANLKLVAFGYFTLHNTANATMGRLFYYCHSFSFDVIVNKIVYEEKSTNLCGDKLCIQLLLFCEPKTAINVWSL